jgi:hypothetical protein
MRLAFAPGSPELDEELDCGREIVDHDADVFHPLDRYVLDGKEVGRPAVLSSSSPRLVRLRSRCVCIGLRAICGCRQL